jgi:uncharacterized sulfatase
MRVNSILIAFLVWFVPFASQSVAADLPNILWITSEDNGPELGCYGDRYATTPNIDGLAEKGLLYRTCWSNAPVCAPARTTIITGVYPTSTGAQHMRSNVPMPAFMKMYPQILREHGYYCTNRSKTDYNLVQQGKVWDQSDRKAHWKNRKEGQPFFAIFNHTISHESRLRTRPHKQVHDPAKVRIRAYHPDTPEVRQDWAQYYDNLTEMDALVGKNLQELEDAGLSDDTIIFYYGDHGSGMPRSKRWPFNSGLHVPLIVYIPEKFAHLRPDDYRGGGSTDRLVSFVDLAPTLLSLIGVKPTEWMQGYAFAGKFTADRQQFIHGYRGRMDERYDMVRSVRDQRYIYIRNYMPHKIYGQYIAYMFQTPTTRIWKNLFDEGKLSSAQRKFWERKPAEELYDLRSDPDEVNNLANSPKHQQIKARLRLAQQELAVDIRDVGFLPEVEFHARAEGSTPYDVGHDPAYLLERIMQAAETATMIQPGGEKMLVQYLKSDDSAIRYWGAIGFLVRETAGPKNEMHKLLKDQAPAVKLTAAQVLAQYGTDEDAKKAIPILLEAAPIGPNNIYVSMLALNALDELDDRAKPFEDIIKNLPTNDKVIPGRMGAYIANLKKKTLADLAK